MSDSRYALPLGMLAVALGLWFLLAPYLVPLIFGAALATAFWPTLKMIQTRLSRFGGRVRAFSVLILILGITVLGVIPFFILGVIASRAVIRKIEFIRHSDFFNPGNYASVDGFFEQFPRISEFLDQVALTLNYSREELLDSFWVGMKSVSLWLGSHLGGWLAVVPEYFFQGFFVLLSFAAILFEKERTIGWVSSLSPLGREETKKISLKWVGLCKSVLWASVTAGAVQAFIFAGAALCAGFGSVSILLLLVFLGSFLPVVGSAPLTFGLGLYALLFVDTSSGVWLLIGASIAGVSDNIVRPLIMKEGSDMHPVVALLGIIGGIQCMGFLGIFLGPIFMGLLIECLKLYSSRTAKLG